jgi:hypothetical protein
MLGLSKFCSKCKVEKPITEFSKAKSGKYGVRADCKVCVLDRKHKLVVNRLPDGSMRECTKCGITKLVSEFHKTNANKAGYRPECIECRQASGREYARTHKKTNHRQYRKNYKGFRAKQKRRDKKRALRIRQEIRSIKESHPCTDCGQFYPYYCMDYDHLDASLKIKHIKGMMGTLSRKHVTEELAKCELVCVNCHRVRTFKRRTDWYNSKVPQRVRNYEIILREKDRPCSDCGFVFHPSAMDFDHRSGEVKVDIIVGCAARFGKEKLLKEIAKCDVVCANCHRKRTFLRMHNKVI